MDTETRQERKLRMSRERKRRWRDRQSQETRQRLAQQDAESKRRRRQNETPEEAQIRRLQISKQVQKSRFLRQLHETEEEATARRSQVAQQVRISRAARRQLILHYDTFNEDEVIEHSCGPTNERSSMIVLEEDHSVDPKKMRLDIGQVQRAISQGTGGLDGAHVSLGHSQLMMGFALNSTSGALSLQNQPMSSHGRSCTTNVNPSSSVNISNLHLRNISVSLQAGDTEKTGLLDQQQKARFPSCGPIWISPNFFLRQNSVVQVMTSSGQEVSRNNGSSNNQSRSTSKSNIHAIAIPAIQIRIGSKKFKPASNVAFKDDGILFTLQKFTYAPVLLNARAILRCKANLTMCDYPAMFFHLEASCMRQIREIFGLKNEHFSADSPIELKQCLTIFPMISGDNKSQIQHLMLCIKRALDAMVKQYPRSTPMLEEITNEQVVDILLASLDQDITDSSGDVVHVSPTQNR